MCVCVCVGEGQWGGGDRDISELRDAAGVNSAAYLIICLLMGLGSLMQGMKFLSPPPSLFPAPEEVCSPESGTWTPGASVLLPDFLTKVLLFPHM